MLEKTFRPDEVEKKHYRAWEQSGAFEAHEDSGPMTTEEFEAALLWVRCMRDQGVDMQDPDPMSGFRPMWRIDRGRPLASFSVN